MSEMNGSDKKRQTLLNALAFHKKHVARIEDLLSRKPGAISKDRVYNTTKKWLEGLDTNSLRKAAERAGVESPLEYEDLEVLIEDTLVCMGLLDVVAAETVDNEDEED